MKLVKLYQPKKRIKFGLAKGSIVVLDDIISPDHELTVILSNTYWPNDHSPA